MPENNAKVFLSSECCRRPINFYGELQKNCFTYILNGADRYAKSKIIDRLAAELSALGLNSILIKNPGDTEMSDGVIFEQINTAIAVGDRRTGLIPKRSPACDIGIEIDPDLHRCDSKTEESLKLLYRGESDAKNRSVRFSKVASELLSDNINLTRRLVNSEKVSRFAERLSLRNLRTIGSKEQGKEYPLFFTAVTPNGYIYYNNAQKLGASKLILLDDPHLAVSSMLISQIKSYALLGGYKVFCSYNPLFQSVFPDFIIIREAGLAVGTIKSGGNNDFDMPVRKVNCRRFYDTEEIKKHRERINFNRQASNEMLYEAVKSLKTAKNICNEISEILCKHTSTCNLQKTYARIRNEIISRL